MQTSQGQNRERWRGDPSVDLITYSLHDAHRLVEWTDAEKAVMFSPGG